MASETFGEHLDPERPWLMDGEQLPRHMDWAATFLSPGGLSPQLHFTRAWTILFFLQFLSIFGVGLALAVIGLAGGDPETLSVYSLYVTAALFLVTSLLSFVAHSRRLRHAGKPALWAGLVLIPLIVSFGFGLFNMSQKTAAYDVMYEERALFLEDPGAWRAQDLAKRRAQAEQATGKSDEDARRDRRKARDTYSAEDKLPTQEEFILRPLLTPFYLIIVGLSALLVPWSLIWVARLRARDPGEALTG